jgi:UDP-GlcNAc:undecaprenyl-phosphate GlcNAc-1-phosphate transferase
MSLIAAFGVAFAITALLVPVATRLARRTSAIDYVERNGEMFFKMSRFGGLAIAAGFYATLLGLFAAGSLSDLARAKTVIAGSVVMLALGVYDDLRGATAAKKLALEIPVAVLTWWGGVRLLDGAVPWPVSLALTTLWIVAAINALNLSDGIDGLAGGIALQVIAVCGLAALHRGETVIPVLILAGAVVGFLCHNFPPARSFMGDSGSLFLGYLLAVAMAWTSQRASTAITTFAPALAIGLPLLDTMLALRRRWSARHPLFLGDLDHVHHRLLAAFESPRGALAAALVINGSLAALALLPIYIADARVGWSAMALAVVLAASVAVRFGYWRRRANPLSAVQRRQA